MSVHATIAYLNSEYKKINVRFSWSFSGEEVVVQNGKNLRFTMTPRELTAFYVQHQQTVHAREAQQRIASR